MENWNDGKMEWWNIEFISWIPAFAGMTKRAGHSVMVLHGISCMIGRLEDWIKECVNGCLELWNAGKMEWWNFLCVF